MNLCNLTNINANFKDGYLLLRISITNVDVGHLEDHIGYLNISVIADGRESQVIASVLINTHVFI